MRFSEYEDKARYFANYSRAVSEPGRDLGYAVLALNGEAGELANTLKKIFRDGRDRPSAEETGALLDELGDVLWYVAAVAYELDASLTEVAHSNILKLEVRRQSQEKTG